VRLLAWGSAGLAVWVLVVAVMMAAMVGGQQPAFGGVTTVGDIPESYLRLYVAAAQRYHVDWAILAAIGSVETDHGRLDPPCATSSSGARGPMQFMPGTWAAPGIGNGGEACDPVDAIPAAARYLVVGGAPDDYHAAILSYNHAEWYYRRVMAKADEYRASASVPGEGRDRAGPLSGGWLATVPGTDQRCDARIVENVQAILATYHAALTACYAATGHEPTGEHPLGLAVDLVPRPPGSWESMARLAAFAGWRESCASTGCAGQTGTAFRFVGWNGYSGHGDPAHAGSGAHLHLSWDHGPGRPAEWVSLVASG
jgi:hypothetical protein